jgi:hypothetical protein
LFSAFGGIPKDQFRLLRGAELIRQFHKSENTILCFCGNCGSSLYAEKPKRNMIHLRLGSLRDEPSLKPQAHAFVSSKVSWYQIHDGLPQFARNSNLATSSAAASPG